jgi:hypothetical protein
MIDCHNNFKICVIVCHLHFENNSDQMKTYKDACVQLKENNYNDFIELEPRDNGLIVQQDMTNDDTNFEGCATLLKRHIEVVLV